VWPAAGSFVYCLGIGVHTLIAALLGLRARVPLAVSACCLLGMTVGAKALSDIREGRFDPGTLLRREHFEMSGMWGGPLVYLELAVPVVVVLAGAGRERGKARMAR
jgi:hypothetical protein